MNQAIVGTNMQSLTNILRQISICLLFLGLGGCSDLTDWVAETFILPTEDVRAPSFSVWTERRVGFVTADGVQLLADVHHPLGPDKTPTILVRIPFTNTFGNRLRSDAIARYWARRGYTVVIQGTRGRYESGGRFYPMVHEYADGKETLNWLARQEWYDGRLAMWGGSAFGQTQWAVSESSANAPQAYFIHIASSNFREMFYPGGAFSLETALFWAMRSRGQEDHEVDIDQMLHALETLPNITADDRATGNTQFYDDWLLNQHNDAYWFPIDGKNRVNKLSGPVFLLAGWFDPFLPTQPNDFVKVQKSENDRIASESQLIIGPWGHALEIELPGFGDSPNYRAASFAPSIAWFDAQLDVSPVTGETSAVKLYVLGANQWRDESEWPLKRTQFTQVLSA